MNLLYMCSAYQLVVVEQIASNWRWQAIGLADGKQLGLQMASNWPCRWQAIGLADGKQLGLQMASNWACRWQAIGLAVLSLHKIFLGEHISRRPRRLTWERTVLHTVLC